MEHSSAQTEPFLLLLSLGCLVVVFFVYHLKLSPLPYFEAAAVRMPNRDYLSTLLKKNNDFLSTGRHRGDVRQHLPDDLVHRHTR